MCIYIYTLIIIIIVIVIIIIVYIYFIYRYILYIYIYIFPTEDPPFASQCWAFPLRVVHGDIICCSWRPLAGLKVGLAELAARRELRHANEMEPCS